METTITIHRIQSRTVTDPGGRLTKFREQFWIKLGAGRFVPARAGWVVEWSCNISNRAADQYINLN